MLNKNHTLWIKNKIYVLTYTFWKKIFEIIRASLISHVRNCQSTVKSSANLVHRAQLRGNLFLSFSSNEDDAMNQERKDATAEMTSSSQNVRSCRQMRPLVSCFCPAHSRFVGMPRIRSDLIELTWIISRRNPNTSNVAGYLFQFLILIGSWSRNYSPDSLLFRINCN